MLQRSFECPVYFIEEDKDVMDVYQSLQSKNTVLSVFLSFFFLSSHPIFSP